MTATQKFKTCLWFNGSAEEAMALYTSLFKNSKVGDINRGPDGRMIAGSFFLEGEEFMAIMVDRNSHPTKPYRSSWTARIRLRSTACGVRSPRTAARNRCAGG